MESTSMTNSTPTGKGLRVISWDGGTFPPTGLSALWIFNEIRARYVDDPDSTTKPHEMFDFFAGSGLAGVYVILFTRYRMGLDGVIDFHHTLYNRLFSNPLWDAKDRDNCAKLLDAVLDEKLGRLVPSLEDWLDEKDGPRGCIPVLNTSSTTYPRLLRTYYTRKNFGPRCTIRQAFHATLADGRHLSPTIISQSGTTQSFVGATLSPFNNPTELLLNEIPKCFPKADGIACIVSIGAGYSEILALSADEATKEELKAVTEDCKRITERLRSQCHSLGSFLYRFSVSQMGKGSNGEDPHSRIIAATDSYLAQDKVSEELDVLVDSLCTRPCIISCQRLVSLAGKDGASRVVADVQHIRNTVSMNDILDRLRPNLPSGVFFREHSPCMSNTRVDILSDIHRWINDLSLPNIAILHGYPGVGKSSIAQSLIEALAKNKQLGARIVCRREESIHHEAKTMWRLIAMELVKMQPTFCAVISAQFDRDNPGHLDALSLAELFGTIIQNPLTALTPATPLVVVIDALDEFGGLTGDQYRRAMLQSLSLWRNLPSTCRLFLTSRALNDIQPLLNTNANTVFPLEVGKRVSAQSEADLRYYYSKEFEDISKDYTSLLQPWPSLPDVEALVRAADGLFIWASTVVSIVRYNPSRLKTIVAQVREGSIAGSIDGLYESLLEAAFPDDSDFENFRVSTGAIIVARAPLTRGGLSRLLKLDEIEIEVVCRALQPVLETFPFLSFHHQSFVDFLVSNGCPTQFRCLAPAQHFNMTISCFSIMTQELHFNMGGMTTSYLTNSEVPDLVEHVHEHILYACQSWGMHLALCDNVIAMENAIVEFLHSKLLFWLEVLSISKCYGQAPAMIISLASKAWSDHANIDQICQDVLSFLRTFAIPISISYPHIYLSALPFTPESSLVRKSFLGNFPQVLKIELGLDEHWPTLQATIRGHNEAVFSVAFSTDGKYIVSGSADMTIRIWDAETQAQIGEPLCGHEDGVTSVTFSHDSKHIISGSHDGTLCIWDLQTQEQIGEALYGHQDVVSSVALMQDGERIISSSRDGTIRIWDTKAKEPIGTSFCENSSGILSVAISKDGRHIVFGSEDHSVRIWDAKSQKPVSKPFLRHVNEVESVAFSPDGKLVASACENGLVCIWDAERPEENEQPLRTWENSSTTCVCFSHDGKWIVGGTADNKVLVWDMETQELVNEPLCGHESSITSISISPDNKRIVSGSLDATIRIWDAGTRTNVDEPFRQGSISSVVMSQDGTQIISTSDGVIRIWDTESQRRIGEILTEWASVESMAISQGGNLVACGIGHFRMAIWNVKSGKQIGELFCEDDSLIESVALSQDGQRIASGSTNCTIRIWDAKNQQSIGKPLCGHEDSVLSVAISQDGTRVVSGSKDCTIRIWDIETQQPIGLPFRGHSNSVTSVAISQDGRRIASGSVDLTVRSWDVETHKPIGKPFNGHKGIVTSVAMSTNGKQIFSASNDSTICIWDIEMQKLIDKPLCGHRGSVHAIALGLDGIHLVSGSEDGTICLWNIETPDGVIGEPLYSFREFLSSNAGVQTNLTNFESATFTNDGWILGPLGEHVLWVPGHLRLLPWPPHCVAIIGAHRKISFGYENFRCGERWIECYSPVSKKLM